MNWKWFGKWLGIFGLAASGVLLLSLSSCARNQHLVAITIQPTSGTFGAADPTLYFDFKAYGTYEHPPQTLDITNQVTWQSDNPQVVQVTSTGVVSPSTGCGDAQIFATYYDSPNEVVSNSATITVDGPASDGCTPPGPQPILTVTVSGTTVGATVTSSPAGITCSLGSSCSAQFATGTPVTLTATPASAFETWSGACNETNGATCVVFLENSASVTATFQ
jgi:hypothetical protein